MLLDFLKIQDYCLVFILRPYALTLMVVDSFHIATTDLIKLFPNDFEGPLVAEIAHFQITRVVKKLCAWC